MKNGVLILTQDHSAIYTAHNLRLEEYGDSETFDLYADVTSNGVKACLRVAKYKTRREAKQVLEALTEKTRIHDGEVFDLCRS